MGAADRGARGGRGQLRHAAAADHLDHLPAARHTGRAQPRVPLLPGARVMTFDAQRGRILPPDLDDRTWQDLVDQMRAPDPALRARVDRPQPQRPRHHPDRAVRLAGRGRHLPAQPGAGQELRRVPQPARDHPRPADPGAHLPHLRQRRRPGGRRRRQPGIDGGPRGPGAHRVRDRRGRARAAAAARHGGAARPLRRGRSRAVRGRHRHAGRAAGRRRPAHAVRRADRADLRRLRRRARGGAAARSAAGPAGPSRGDGDVDLLGRQHRAAGLEAGPHAGSRPEQFPGARRRNRRPDPQRRRRRDPAAGLGRTTRRARAERSRVHRMDDV